MKAPENQGRPHAFGRPNSCNMIRVTREVHEVPASVEERVTRAGGLNWFGEPNFRVVWGGSRLTWIGGRWTDWDANGNFVRQCAELRNVPKYLPTDRWHIERWLPPTAYGPPENWWVQTIQAEDGTLIPALGPYPSRGEYEHCFTLQNSRGEFVRLTATACDWIVRAIEWARRQPRAAIRAAVATRESRCELEQDKIVDEVLSDAALAFNR